MLTFSFPSPIFFPLFKLKRLFYLDGTGVHVEQIRASVKPGQNFMSDIQFLLDEGKIYTTLDDDHFSVIDDVFQ